MKLSICNLTKKYDSRTVVDHVNLELTSGITGLLGPNGAGKTTLIRMICDLIPADEGQVLLDGREIHQLGARYRDILGYVPQKVGFYPWFTGEKYLMYLAVLKGLEKREAAEKIDELLEKTGLADERKKRLKAYSGGMIQRIGIAQALLNDPEILILDEPTAGLDPRERIRFRTLLAGLAKDRLVLLSTHIVSDISQLAGQVLMMKNGGILVQEPAEQICGHLEGKVCTLEVRPEEAEEYQDRYMVTNMQPGDGRIRLRLVCPDGLPEGALPVPPGLEDAYLALCGGEDKKC